MNRIWSVYGPIPIRYPKSFKSSVIITLLSSQAVWVLVRTKVRTSLFIFFIFVAAMVIPFQSMPLAVANFAGAYIKQWDLILTAILMAMVPIIIFFLAAQKHMIQGMVWEVIK